MCGIAGLIGTPKKPRLSHELMTILFDCLEMRGVDASGMWGVESGGESRIVYHKEPVRSSKFVTKPIWKQVVDLEPDLLLLHARAASSGPATNNVNNHPFASYDRKIAMVHNGRIDEADALGERYQTVSDTDSEVLLRMYEAGLQQPFDKIDGVPDDIAMRISGIGDIWSHVYNGAMAVAIGERADETTRYLFLFHNPLRPLWFIDLRERFGQIVFFSSPDVWYRAMGSSSVSLQNTICGFEKLVEVPSGQIWAFKIDEQNPHPTESNTNRFEVDVDENGEEWVPGDKVPVNIPMPEEINVPVITELNESDELVLNVEANHQRHIATCNDISERITTIEWYLRNNTYTQQDYDEAFESLMSISDDLRGTEEILRRS